MARVLEAGKPPRMLGVVRPAEPGDDRRFFDSALTPDGRYYLWSGPRLPLQNSRVEVREVATGRLIRRIVGPADPAFRGFLDPRGRELWIRGYSRVFSTSISSMPTVPQIAFP